MTHEWSNLQIKWCTKQGSTELIHVEEKTAHSNQSGSQDLAELRKKKKKQTVAHEGVAQTSRANGPTQLSTQ